jgi:DNA end-binding protein Ku
MPSTVWRGQLTFGLVSVPVRLHRAARKERVRFQYVSQQSRPVEESEDAPLDESLSFASKDRTKEPIPIHGHAGGTRPEGEADGEEVLPVIPLKQSFASPEGRTIPRQEVLKGYQVAPNQYVTVRNEELRQLRLPTSPTMEILRTTRLPEIDPLYFETSYYVVPEAMGERAYALLYAALQETNYAAVAKVVMHGREHIMLVRTGKKGLLAHTLYYHDELRAETEFPTDLSSVVPKELALAKTFVEAIAGPFAPEDFRDSYREQLQQLIATKTARQEIAPASRPENAAAPMADIMEALTKSLERAKKSAPTTPPRRLPGKAIPEKRNRRKA